MPTPVRSLSNDDRETLASIYAAMISIGQEIRQSVERVTVVGIGALLATTGWFIGASDRLRSDLRLFVALAMCCYGGLLYLVVHAMWGRYKGVAHVTRNLNVLQGAHEHDRFLHDAPLMPTAWRRFGTDQWLEPIFRVAFASLPLSALACALAVVVS
jgi:hypothetical protein